MATSQNSVVLRISTPGSARASKALAGLSNQAKLLAGALGFVGLGVGFVKSIALMKEFEFTMARVRSVAGSTDAEFKALTQTARGLGATTVFSARQAADGMVLLGQAGFDTNEIIAATGSALKLAQAGSLSLASAADITAKTVRQFGLEASAAGQIADVFAKAAASANTNVEQLGHALSFVAPDAKKFGFDLIETTAIIGALSDAGLQGGRAGASLRQVFRAIVKPTTEASQKFRELGISAKDLRDSVGNLDNFLKIFVAVAGDATATTDIFSSRSSTAATIIGTLTDRVRALQASLTDSGGAAETMAAIMNNTLKGALLSLRSGVEEAVLQVGDAGLLGGLKSLIQVIAGVVAAQNGMLQRFKETTVLTKAQEIAITKLTKVWEVFVSFVTLLAIRFAVLRTASLAYAAAIAIASVATGGFAASAGLLLKVIAILGGTALVNFGSKTQVVLGENVKRWRVWYAYVTAALGAVGDGFLQLFNRIGTVLNAISNVFNTVFNFIGRQIGKLFSLLNRAFGLDLPKVINLSIGKINELGDALKAYIDTTVEGFSFNKRLAASLKEISDEAGKAAKQKELVTTLGEVAKALDGIDKDGNIFTPVDLQAKLFAETIRDLVIDLQILGAQDLSNLFESQAIKVVKDDYESFVNTVQQAASAIGNVSEPLKKAEIIFNKFSKTAEGVTDNVIDLKKQQRLLKNSFIEQAAVVKTAVTNYEALKKSFIEGKISATKFRQETKLAAAEIDKQADAAKKLGDEYDKTTKIIVDKSKEQSDAIKSALSVAESLLNAFKKISDFTLEKGQLKEEISNIAAQIEALQLQKADVLAGGLKNAPTEARTIEREILKLSKRQSDLQFKLDGEFSTARQVFGVLREVAGVAKTGLDLFTAATKNATKSLNSLDPDFVGTLADPSVFKGKGKAFQTGGIVPGAGPQNIRAHGGELIFNPLQLNNLNRLVSGLAGGGGGKRPVINLSVRNNSSANIGAGNVSINTNHDEIDVEMIVTDIIGKALNDGQFDSILDKRVNG